MKRTKRRTYHGIGTSSVESAKELVPRPIAFWFSSVKPYNDEVVVEIEYRLHNSNHERKGKQGTKTFFYGNDEFMPKLKAITDTLECNKFAVIDGGNGPLSKTIATRDKLYSSLHMHLCKKFDELDNAKTERYSEVERYLLENCHDLFRAYALFEAVVKVATQSLEGDLDLRETLDLSRTYRPAEATAAAVEPALSD